MNAVKTMETIRNHAETVADDSPRQVGSLAIGDHVAQGDVMFWLLPVVPDGCVEIEPVTQLAPGTTQGSRHCLRALDGITFHRLANPNPLQGPILKCDKPVTVEHPEHGNQTLPEGVWFVTYQRAFADELRRVQD